jgi:hypothetical protein
VSLLPTQPRLQITQPAAEETRPLPLELAARSAAKVPSTTTPTCSPWWTQRSGPNLALQRRVGRHQEMMGIFAVEHIVNNLDSWAEIGKTFTPTSLKMAGG